MLSPEICYSILSPSPPTVSFTSDPLPTTSGYCFTLVFSFFYPCAGVLPASPRSEPGLFLSHILLGSYTVHGITHSLLLFIQIPQKLYLLPPPLALLNPSQLQILAFVQAPLSIPPRQAPYNLPLFLNPTLTHLSSSLSSEWENPASTTVNSTLSLTTLIHTFIPVLAPLSFTASHSSISIPLPLVVLLLLTPLIANSLSSCILSCLMKLLFFSAAFFLSTKTRGPRPQVFSFYSHPGLFILPCRHPFPALSTWESPATLSTPSSQMRDTNVCWVTFWRPPHLPGGLQLTSTPRLVPTPAGCLSPCISAIPYPFLDELRAANTTFSVLLLLASPLPVHTLFSY